ncbi:hypothetical protein MKW98_004969 [Papaver atlanticum]|uniref:Fungal lipase-type domain-containing protein n=1 Tax=Papaver atlanticum TaxID=357466 RepID=A0AAD4THB5_9MAGN|nr:hypothetical protein MKW98_004969 [Papaver atlanticum]
MASERDDFIRSGPLHLTTVNWGNVHHRRSIAASLVQGVYVLERDRQEKNRKALAPPWWEFFHFELFYTLVDDVDSSIFGAIYEFKQEANRYYLAEIPRFVIAFRGTITQLDCLMGDLSLDLNLIQNGLHQTSRFGTAMKAVIKMVSVSGASNVWLTGHSLGSSIAMLAGKNMARTGHFLESYLFNPPFISAPIERIKDNKVRHGIRIASSLITAGLTFAMKVNQESQQSEDPFDVLSTWIPNLFVNPSDHLCCEYIRHFEHRENMESFGAGGIARLAMKNSLTGLLMNAMGWEYQEELQLIPSAYLTINRSPSPNFKRAHGIHQWFRGDLSLHSKVYQYKL